MGNVVLGVAVLTLLSLSAASAWSQDLGPDGTVFGRPASPGGAS